jgi:hypothetical protein
MSTALIDFIQKKMDYPPLEKVDPVDHEVKNDENRSSRARLAQAAIPAVLAGIHKITRTENGRETILFNDLDGHRLDTIFGDKKWEAVDKVAHYANVPAEEAEKNMEDIAAEAILGINESVIANPTHEAVIEFMAQQRHSILVYLPAVMQLGNLLEDDSLDDRTNKMEGPMSNLMHSIENNFSGGGKQKTENF